MSADSEQDSPQAASRLPEGLYLLSLWREESGGPYRAALRPAGGGPRLGFADLEQLAAYLLRLADADLSAPERPP